MILVPIISPYIESRMQARKILSPGFYEVYFNAGLSTVMSRDAKGLYAKAAKGEINNLIGYSPTSRYEPPISPDFVANTESEEVSITSERFYRFVAKKLVDCGFSFKVK